MWRSPSGSAGGQPVTKLMSNPFSRSPTAVAPGWTRVTAPPIAQAWICENGDVNAATRSRKTSITASESCGSRCDFQ